MHVPYDVGQAVGDIEMVISFQELQESRSQLFTTEKQLLETSKQAAAAQDLREQVRHAYCTCLHEYQSLLDKSHCV